MRYFLQKNWSEQFRFGEAEEHIFIGRDREVKSLKHAIQNNTSSTILVSSVRGVGKTSFVHRALWEIKDNITPIFVNVGHTLRERSGAEPADMGKVFLVSLIRATYLADIKEFTSDNELKQLYYQAIGTFQKQEESTTSVLSLKKLGLILESKPGIRDLIRTLCIVLGAGLSTLGFVSDRIALKVAGGLGFLTLLLSASFRFDWLRESSDTSTTRSGYKLDNSTEYLETRFEQWLETKRDATRRIVFVIDELDRDEPADSLKAIKEYKNLFARSFAHFIFISNDRAYGLTQEGRRDSTHPTLFTHVYYLPTPTSEEMHSYLNRILNITEPTDDTTELKKYLLFEASNDFFSLKNLINDLAEFDASGEQYLDSETLRRTDKHFADVVKLYDLIDCYYRYYSRTQKRYWQQNSQLQEHTFSFIQKHLMEDFEVTSDLPEDVQKLVLFLARTGVIEPRDWLAGEDEGPESEEGSSLYGWTGIYRDDLDSLDQLFPEDVAFIEALKRLIRLANDLNDLPKQEGFTEFQEVFEEADGESLSGINLFEVFQKYDVMYRNLTNPDHPENRLYARAQAVQEATREIENAIAAVDKRTFSIFAKTLELIVESEEGIVHSARESSLPDAFPLRSWEAPFGKFTSQLFSGPQGNQVLIIAGLRHFGDDRVTALTELAADKKLLVLNFTSGEALPRHPVLQKHPSGRNRKEPLEVKNFFSYQRPADPRDLAEPLQLAIEHLKKN